MQNFKTAVADRDTLAADIAAREAAGEVIPLNDLIFLEHANVVALHEFFRVATAR